MTRLTVLVDYESGNLHSAEKAFQRMAAETGAGEGGPQEFAIGTAVVDLAAFTLLRDGITHPLSPKEAAMLALRSLTGRDFRAADQFARRLVDRLK